MKLKIRYKKLFVFLGIIVLLILIFIKIFNLRISNIYISGNLYVSDEEIIELASLSNYPKAIITLSGNIQKNLLNNIFIKSANVKKSGLTKIYIDVLENKPILYNEVDKRTILADGNTTELVFDTPVLVNTVEASIYNAFLECVNSIDDDILKNISEISYTPNDVDKELFLLTMKDGNYVYINLSKFDSINQYLDIIKKFNNKKGILYLDSGEYFKILSN